MYTHIKENSKDGSFHTEFKRLHLWVREVCKTVGKDAEKGNLISILFVFKIIKYHKKSWQLSILGWGYVHVKTPD